MSNEKAVLGIEVRAESGSIKRLYVRICQIRDGEARGMPDESGMGDIVCSAYVGHSGQSSIDRPENELWGWDVSAEGIHYASASQLERIAKVMRSIVRKMEKMDETEGRAESFGQYVNRFGRAVGAAKVRQVVRRDARGWLPIRDAAFAVDSLRRVEFPTSTELATA